MIKILLTDDPAQAIEKINSIKDAVNILTRSKDYHLGDIAYTDSIASNLFLECTTAGTTSDTDISGATLSEGNTLTDGTVVWTVRKIVSYNDVAKVIKTSGASTTYFYTNGTYEVPDGVEYIYVSGCAGGGGGSFCGGGGGGESVDRKKIKVTPGEKIAITIGSGGAASETSMHSTSKVLNAGDGGNTVFGNYFTLNGGKGLHYNQSSGAETQMPLAGGNGATNGSMCASMQNGSPYWTGGNGGHTLFGKGGSGGAWSVYCSLNDTKSKYMNGTNGIGYGSGGGGCGACRIGAYNYVTGAGSGANGFIMIEVV